MITSYQPHSEPAASSMQARTVTIVCFIFEVVAWITFLLVSHRRVAGRYLFLVFVLPQLPSLCGVLVFACANPPARSPPPPPPVHK